MTVSARDQQAIAQGLEKAKEASTTGLVVDGFLLALYGALAMAVAATATGPLWPFVTQIMAGTKGFDIIGGFLKRHSLKQAERDIEQDPSGAKPRDKIARLKNFSKKCFIAGAAIWGACLLASFAPLVAPLAVPPLFVGGMTTLLAGAFAMEIQKGAETAVKAVDAVLSPAPATAPAAPAASPAPAAPSKVASLSAGPSFTAAANDDKDAAPAPKAEPVKRPFRTFDF
ncbi:MAG: hypothetical protein ACAH83_05230 [Alphaproteobacteria bacterium]